MAAWDGSYKAGLNFRATSSYDTDPTNTGYHGNESTSNIKGAMTVTLAGGTDTIAAGWAASGGTPAGDVAGGGGRDRNSALDGRIAGCIMVDTNVIRDFVVTLPSAGDYYIWLSFGDSSDGFSGQVWEILDSTTSRGTYSYGSTTAGQFVDATETLRANGAAWVTANDDGTTNAVLLTFATTTLRLRVGDTTSGFGARPNHISLLKNSGAGTPAKRGRSLLLGTG